MRGALLILAGLPFRQDGAAGNCVGDTTAVGSYPSGASPYGVLDMGGNAAEWVYDWYASDYYGTSPGSNPRGPTTGANRVGRGGSCAGYANFCRVADRVNESPSASAGGLGFRTVMPARN